MATIVRINPDPTIHNHSQSVVLVQSKTHLTHITTHGQKDSLNLGEYTSYVSDESTSSTSTCEDDSDSDSSSSSDWDARTVISTVSTILPSKHYSNNNTEIITPITNERFESEQFLIEFNDDILDRDITYDLYSLFYPFTNMQSLIFSNIYPYIESDYKHYKSINNNAEEEEIEEQKHNNTQEHNMTMDWTDMNCVNRINELIQKLLLSCSSQSGIKEEEIYLMFTSPSPMQIIQHLRFGLLSLLCDVHIDRFGRRSYHYKQQKSELHFYNHSRVPSQMFNNHDIIGLSDFIQEDNKNKTEIAKIHYHDNDIVMSETQNENGTKTETQIQWQNFAIHSYLYRRTRARFPAKTPQSVRSVSTRNIHEDQSVIGRKHARGISGISAKNNMNNNIQKEGFLEKRTNNIITKQWIKYWCILWNDKMLLYKNKKKNKQPIEIIDLNNILLPISISFDAINRLFQFRLDLNNDNKKDYCVFRTKSEFQRKSWISNIETILQYDKFDENNKTRKKTSDKTESCIIM